MADDLEEEKALIMLDGCTSHFSDVFLDECSYNNVYPFQEPAGSSDQVQALDLGIFSVQKLHKKHFKPPRSIKNDSEKEIMAIVDSWRHATTPRNVVSAFNQAGIYRNVVNDEVVMAANIKYARAVRGMAHEDPPDCVLYERNRKIPVF